MKIAIIGAGIVGLAIARELSRYQCEIHVFEKNEDVGMGTSKANTGIIHAGFDDDPKTLRAKFCERGNEIWHKWVNELKIPARWCGEIVVAKDEKEMRKLEELKKRGEKNKVRGIEIWEKEVLNKEKNLNTDVIGALYAPTGGVMDSFFAPVAIYENTVDNGVIFHFNSEVINLEERNKGIMLETEREKDYFDLVINSAGLYGDKIASLMGYNFKIYPRKGEYLIFPKNSLNLNYIIFPAPSEKSKGVVVENTPAGNLMIGPNAQDIEDKEDVSTTEEGLNYVYENAKEIVKNIPPRNESIRQFSGLRAETENHDFIITLENKFWNVIGIRSPGLTSAPGIGEFIRSEIEKRYKIRRKEKWNLYRKEYPKYGKVICDCEDITEGEIREAIRRGATTVEGVKRRTMAGMGSCQGSFCLPRIMKIISEERNIPFEKVEMKKGAYILAGKLR